VIIALDTNVLVSGLLRADAPPAEILARVVRAEISVCFDERVIGEYREVLLRPRFSFDANAVEMLINQIEMDGVPVVCERLAQSLSDLDDDVFVEVALAGRANCLVTGNTRHFPLNRCQGVLVMSPRQFVDAWPSRRSSGD
jgi:putative PIN family toxin of toxin-antitoxin system